MDGVLLDSKGKALCKTVGNVKHSRPVEMNKLDAALTEIGIEHTYNDDYRGGTQIVVTENGKYRWDAICTPDSYGWNEGLLEVMGKPLLGHAGVMGYRTAEDILKMLKESKTNAKP